MNGNQELLDLESDLRAAATGAAGIASSVVASGNIEAATGVNLPGLPGPGLQSVLAQRSGRVSRAAGVDPGTAPRVAGHMAASMGNQAVDLLRGK